MESRRFLNQLQPQTLQIATMLLYVNAIFAIVSLDSLLGETVIALGELVALAGAAGGYGIANDKKWGYQLGVVTAVIAALDTVAIVLHVGTFSFSFLITLLFQGALVGVLLHPMSRNYVKTWFK